MRRVRPLPLALVAALCAGGAMPAAAGAQDVPAAIVTDFRQDGRVEPCDHSAGEVRRALDELPADADVLTPDLPQQLQASAEAHTSGRCRAAGVASEGEAGGAGAGDAGDAAEAQRAMDEAIAVSKDRAPGSPDQANLTPQPAPPNAQAPAARGDAIGRAASSDPARTAAGALPAPLWLLLALAAAMLVAALVWAALRAMGTPAPWDGPGRHGRREAAWRASNAWSEFTDWVRLGR